MQEECRKISIFQFFLRPYVRTKVREIRRSHCSDSSDRLLVSGQFTRAKVTLVTNDTLVEVIFRQEIQGQGENTATFIYKVKNLGNAEDHSSGGDGELNSNKVKTARIGQFYRNEINATKKSNRKLPICSQCKIPFTSAARHGQHCTLRTSLELHKAGMEQDNCGGPYRTQVLDRRIYILKVLCLQEARLLTALSADGNSECG